MTATPMAANGLIYKMFTKLTPRGCDVLKNGLITSPVHRTLRHPTETVATARSEYSSLRAGPELQDNELTYHSRPVSHAAPQTGKSISYLSHV